MEPTVLQLTDSVVLTTMSVVFWLVAIALLIWSIFGPSRETEALGLAIFIGIIAVGIDLYTSGQKHSDYRIACHAAGGVVLKDTSANKFCVSSENFIQFDEEQR